MPRPFGRVESFLRLRSPAETPAYHLMLWYAGPLLFSGYAISKHSAEQCVYLKAERLEHLFKQGYSEDAEMTFEVYARGWLERQTKYAPYDRLLPTFARNRVPSAGMGSYFYHSSFNASATSCAMRCLSSSLFACAYRSSAASRRSAACRDHTSNSPLVISPLLIRAKYFLYARW